MRSIRYDPQQRRIVGDGPIQRHMLLIKMVDALDNAPTFSAKTNWQGNTPERAWLSQVGALLSRVSIDTKISYSTTYSMFWKYPEWSVNAIKGHLLDAIEEIKLELELDGRTDIGSAYAPGDTYRFFADLKSIVGSAQQTIFAVDPYLNGETFNAYFGACPASLTISILCERYASDVADYITRHKQQYASRIYLRKSKEIHDRIIIVDEADCWVIGGSLKDAGRKPTYLVPVSVAITADKLRIYGEIWGGASAVALP
jgi:hypothetical protein